LIIRFRGILIIFVHPLEAKDQDRICANGEMLFFDEALLMIGCSTLRSVLRFFWRNFLSVSKNTPRRQRAVVCFGWNCSPGLCAGCGMKQPPRRASAEPESRHVGCFLLRLVCRVSIPGPRGRGPGFKTR
jgi:hypothetical protein